MRGRDPIDSDRLTHDEFYIEKILAHHYTKHDMLKYLIQFKGFDSSYNLWLDERDVFVTKDFLDKYYQNPTSIGANHLVTLTKFNTYCNTFYSFKK